MLVLIFNDPFFPRFCRKKFSPLWSPKLWTMHLISVSDNPADVEFFLTRWRPWPNLNLRVCILINHSFSFVMLATHIYFPDLVSICVVYMKLLVLFKSFWDCFCILQDLSLGLGLGRRPSKQTCARVMNISCDFWFYLPVVGLQCKLFVLLNLKWGICEKPCMSHSMSARPLVIGWRLFMSGGSFIFFSTHTAYLLSRHRSTFMLCNNFDFKFYYSCFLFNFAFL